MNLNKVFLIGRLTSDPQLRVTPLGKSVCSFGLATNRIWVDNQGQKQKDTQFHNIVVWGRQAEIAHQFLKKGSIVFIEGHLRTRLWQDNQMQNRKVTEIIVERLQIGPQVKSSFSDSGFPSQQNSFKEELSEFTEDLEFKEALPEIDLTEEEVKPEDIPF